MNASFKGLDALPITLKYIINKAIESGEHALVWFGKLQGQINFRVQSFLNNDIPIENPKFMRFYSEVKTPQSTTHEAEFVYHELEIELEEEFRGKYLITLSLQLGCDSTNSLIKADLDHNGEPLFSKPTSIKVNDPEAIVPINLTCLVNLTESKHKFTVNLSCSKPTMRSANLTAYFSSLHLVKID